MHETAIACEIMKLADNECRKVCADRPVRIEVEVGKNAGIDTRLLQYTLDLMYRECYHPHTVEVDITAIPTMLRCKDCHAIFSPDTMFAPCPFCSSYRHELLQGNELRLSAVWIDNETPKNKR